MRNMFSRDYHLSMKACRTTKDVTYFNSTRSNNVNKLQVELPMVEVIKQ